MDHQRFDAVTRRFAQAQSRRTLIGMLAASVVAAVLPRRNADAQEWYCPPGDVYCGDAGCRDLSSDTDHCGACFEVCESDLVAVDCVSGQCVPTTCGPYLSFCGILGGCANLEFDPFNCGGCGNVCDSGVCSDGVCQPSVGSCPPWLTDCGAGGCVDLSSDLDHCGGCFETCESGLVAVACQNGQCVRNQCGPDRTYCGVLGGCLDTSSDPLNCGGCDIVCPFGTDCWYGTCR
jgi:hypothetical protein